MLEETFEVFGGGEVPIRAAALAFYTLVSIFPLVLFLFFLANNGIEVDGARETLSSNLNQVVPQVAAPIEDAAEAGLRARGPIGLLSALGLLWSASGMFNVLSLTMNRIWGAVPRSFWRRRAVALFSVLLIVGLFLVSIALSALATWLALPEVGRPGWVWLNRLLGMGFAVLVFALVYRSLPNRKVDLGAAFSGALVGALLWEAAKLVFGWFVASGLNRYGMIYGSLASVIVLVIWLYLTAFSLYFGAAFGAVIEKRRLGSARLRHDASGEAAG